MDKDPYIYCKINSFHYSLDAVHDLEESSVHYWSIASSEHDILFSFGMSRAFVFTD